MPEGERGTLRLHADGPVMLAEVRAYLKDLELAYAGSIAFEELIAVSERRWTYLRRQGPWPFEVMSWPGLIAVGQFDDETIFSLVPARHRLRLHRVSMSSPGFWEVLGRLNPLQFISEYLQGRHERRADLTYRWEADERRRRIEDAALLEEVLSRRIHNMHEAGASEPELAACRRRFLEEPLLRLASHQDSAAITTAEVTVLGVEDDPG